MAGRPYVFEKNWEENPPPRWPTTTMQILPGLPPADGHDPPQVRASPIPSLSIYSKIEVFFADSWVHLFELHNRGFRSAGYATELAPTKMGENS
jgi:hypothetical protein